MSSSWLQFFGNDLYALLISVIALLAYHLYLRERLRRDPTYTIHGVNVLARTAWVGHVMQAGNRDILAVQTLRNAIMGPVFLASTAALLMVGTLTLTGQIDKLGATWHELNLFGTISTLLWQGKIIMLLLDFMVAFFAFTQSIRLFIHVGFMINVPVALDHGPLAPAQVALHLNRAGSFHSIGMRAYYFAVPLTFWLFGPHFMLLATFGLIPALYMVDRTPGQVPERGDL
ncbi:MAG TPA: DUF599 domain-containing protein [Burkholderiales bacterium]|nr:DUF599 domain-containing protein [Burkholderiales bacterium]